MGDNSGSSGPVVEFKWTFPLFRVVSQKTKSVKNRVASMRSEDSSMPDTVVEAVGEDSDDEPEVNENLEDIKNRLDSVTDTDDNLAVGQEKVRFEGDVFVPTEVEIDKGQGVKFTNNSDSSVEIQFDNGSGLTVEAGGEGIKQFEQSGAYDFSISGVDVQDTCGAVIVGDTDEEPDLPCRGGVERELFEDTEEEKENKDVEVEETQEMSVDVSPSKSMSAAAEDKEREF